MKVKELIAVLKTAIRKSDGEVSFFWGTKELDVVSISAYQIIPDVTIRLGNKKGRKK